MATAAGRRRWERLAADRPLPCVVMERCGSRRRRSAGRRDADELD
jgi:hypothetical protein